MPTVSELVTRSGELKRELVLFAKTPRLQKHLNARFRQAKADRGGQLDESMAVMAIDEFVLQDRLPDGRSVVEYFLDQRKPALSEDEAAMVLGWLGVVEGCFELHEVTDDSATLHNLVDDVTYLAHSTAPSDVFPQLRPGMFVIGRLVPLHSSTDVWLISGQITMYAAETGPVLARAAVRILNTHPQLLRTNPDLWTRSWALQAEERAAFVETFGSDLVVLPPAEAKETLAEHQRTRASEGAAAEQPGHLLEEMLDADNVAIVFDETEGLHFFRDFGHLDDLFADPALTRDRSYLARMQAFLRDVDVPALAIRRLVARHPEHADGVFRALLRKPAFSWERDGENLLARHKYLDDEPGPTFCLVGERLRELLRTEEAGSPPKA